MNQLKSDPKLKEPTEASLKKSSSSLGLMAIITLRILGFRKKEFNELEFEQLTGTQVGIAAMLALVGFTAIIAILSIIAVKIMG